MKKWFLLWMVVLAAGTAFGQDVNSLLKEAVNFERVQKEEEALAKYKEVLAADRNNLQALVKAAELSCAVGARKDDKKQKLKYFNEANGYAQAAVLVDPQHANAHYVNALVAAKMVQVESENKKVVEYVKLVKDHADKALAIDPNHARANYIIGKWHFEMVDLNWAKKAAVKLLYGGLPTASMDSAFAYMEKARRFDQYFVLNYLDLAKAYKYDDKPAKAIEVLNKLVKLPTRTADDPALKEEGKRMLNEMQ